MSVSLLRYTCRDPRVCPGCLGYAIGDAPDLSNMTYSITTVQQGMDYVTAAKQHCCHSHLTGHVGRAADDNTKGLPAMSSVMKRPVSLAPKKPYECIG